MKKLMITAMTLLVTSLAFAEGGGSSAGVPNPASVYCVKVAQGKEVTLNSQLGQDSYCEFKGGALISSWTLYRARGEGSQIAVDVYLTAKRVLKSLDPNGPVGLPNPASVFCAQVGGLSVMMEDSEGGQLGICEFSDHSKIEEWTLFRKTADKSNAALTTFLRNAR